MISDGCFLKECTVQHSIVGIRSRLDSGVQIKVIFLYCNILYNEQSSIFPKFSPYFTSFILFLSKILEWISISCSISLNLTWNHMNHIYKHFSGYHDHGCWLLPNRSWNCFPCSSGKCSNRHWEKYKNCVRIQKMLSNIFTLYSILHEKICMVLNYTNHYIGMPLNNCHHNYCSTVEM